jgi:hypothetical protein
MNIYRKALLAGGLLLIGVSLGGCPAAVQTFESGVSLVTGSTVTPQQIIVAATSFDGLAATATTYITGCNQKRYACAQSTVYSIIAAVRSGRKAELALKAFLKANPGSNAPISNYTLLTTAIDSVQTYSSQMAAN